MTLAERQSNAMQVPNEIEPFFEYICARKPKVIVEIGTASGGTLARWLQIPSAEMVISVDLPEGIHGGQSPEDRVVLTGLCRDFAQSRMIRFEAIDGDSKEDATLVTLKAALLHRKIDFLFIDADHSYEGVASDYYTYAPFVACGGAIAFHDIINSAWQNSIGAGGPYELWQRITANRSGKTFIDSKQAVEIWPHTAPDGFGGIGVIEW